MGAPQLKVQVHTVAVLWLTAACPCTEIKVVTFVENNAKKEPLTARVAHVASRFFGGRRKNVKRLATLPTLLWSRVRLPVLLDFLSTSGSGTGSTQPREDK
jgi:hypothetical protein